MPDCKWMQDEICVNADCPMRADYCPVPDVPGVCRFEEKGAMAMRPSPCKTCLQKDKCPNMCDVWKIWFHDSWDEIQQAAFKKYGYGGKQ